MLTGLVDISSNVVQEGHVKAPVILVLLINEEENCIPFPKINKINKRKMVLLHRCSSRCNNIAQMSNTLRSFLGVFNQYCRERHCKLESVLDDEK